MVKSIHIATVVITLILFLFRGGWYWLRPSQPLMLPLRILPHLNDTVLTISGVTMAIMYAYNPFEQLWFMAKIVALLAYIGLGMYAFREKHLYGKRLLAWFIALLMFVYIFAVVRTHNALIVF